MSFATVLIIAAATAVGVIAGLARKGELRNLANHGLRWSSLAVLSAGLLVWVEQWADDPSIELSIIALALITLFVLRNLHLVGMSIVLIGVALNLAGTIANEGTAVDPEAAVAARLIEPGQTGATLNHGGRHLRTETDRAWWLGEAVPLRPLRDVVSFGDLIAAAGMLDVGYRLTKRRRLRHPHLTPSAQAGLAAIEAGTSRLDDEPLIDLRLMAEASRTGYAEAWPVGTGTRLHELHTPPAADQPRRADSSPTTTSSRSPDPSMIVE